MNICNHDPFGSVIEFPLTGDEFECLEQILNKYPDILDYDVDICNLSLKICFNKKNSAKEE